MAVNGLLMLAYMSGENDEESKANVVAALNRIRSGLLAANSMIP